MKLTVIALLLSTLLPVASIASDRDTPAYRIYVDPVTGRYSTKPPEAQGAQTGQTVTAPATAVPVTIAALPNGPDLRRPLKAVLLLLAIATLSLLARAWKSSRSA